MPVGLLGLRGSGSFTADERPKNWRQLLLLINPNGDAPLTALLSKMPQEPTDDPEFNFFEKAPPIQRGIITGASITTNVSPASGADIAAADATAEVALRVKPDGGADQDMTWLAPGYVLVNQTTEEVYVVIRVGTNFANIRRDVGDKFVTNPAITGDQTTGDPIVVTGYAIQEGAPVGSPVTFQPIRHFNFTEIFRTPLSVTRTARRTKLRYDKTGPYQEAKREAHQTHMQQLERALLFNERAELTSLVDAAAPFLGGNNPISASNPARTTRGMLNWLPAITSAATPTLHWDVGVANSGALGEDQFDDWLAELFRFGSDEKLLFCGSTFLNVLNKLAKNKMTIQAVPTDRTYGMAFNRYLTPFGSVLVKSHPLLNADPVWRKDCFAIDLPFLRTRVLDETVFLRNRQAPGDDASTDEFLTELGLECRHSGAVPSTAGGLQATAGPGVHGRLKGVATFAG